MNEREAGTHEPYRRDTVDDYQPGPVPELSAAPRWRGTHPSSNRIDPGSAGQDSEQIIELREEQLIAEKDMRERGAIEIRTVVDEVPARLEAEVYREEVEVEHVPVGLPVKERVEPWEEDGVLVVPVYEEQLILVKRLIVREHLRIRRVPTAETRLFEDTVRRERLVVDDPAGTGLYHEEYPVGDGVEEGYGSAHRSDTARPEAGEHRGFFENIRRALE